MGRKPEVTSGGGKGALEACHPQPTARASWDVPGAAGHLCLPLGAPSLAEILVAGRAKGKVLWGKEQQGAGNCLVGRRPGRREAQSTLAGEGGRASD